MGILVEYNPDLALRDITFYKEGKRELEECIPEELEVGKIYDFLKNGQRNYYLLDDEPVPLIKTDGNQNLSRPYASIKILEATHFSEGGELFTKGKYEIVAVHDIHDSKIHFEGFLSVKK